MNALMQRAYEHLPALVASGLRVPAIAERLGVSEDTTRAWMKAHGFPLTQRARRYSASERAALVARVRGGETVYAVARDADVSPGAIRRWVGAAGDV